MVISAIIGMMSACCENILGIKYRYRDENGEWMGGAFVYMERGLGFRHMAKIFCVLLVIASLGIGNMTQANAAALSLSGSFGLSPAITGLILARGRIRDNLRRAQEDRLGGGEDNPRHDCDIHSRELRCHNKELSRRAVGVFAHNIRGFFSACGGRRSGGLRDKKLCATGWRAEFFQTKQGSAATR